MQISLEENKIHKNDKKNNNPCQNLMNEFSVNKQNFIKENLLQTYSNTSNFKTNSIKEKSVGKTKDEISFELLKDSKFFSDEQDLFQKKTILIKSEIYEFSKKNKCEFKNLGKRKNYNKTKIINENSNIILENNDKQKKRKYIKSKDVEVSQHKYSCKECGKLYIGYPAYYTHRRNRHNVIPITKRHLFFHKNSEEAQKLKYAYNSITYEKIIDFEFSDFLIDLMKKILEKIYYEKHSIFSYVLNSSNIQNDL